MLTGLLEFEGPIEIAQNTHAKLSATLAAARAAEQDFGDAQTARKAANAALATSDNAAKVFITNARKRLSKFFGERYSTEWSAAGWPNGSTSTPPTQDDRLALVENIRLHLVDHPAHESVDMDVTAAIAATVKATMTTARGVRDVKLTLQNQARQARDAAVATLRRRMTGLIAELDTLLDGEDARWYAFGLSRPADEDRPEPPTVMTALPGTAPGVVLVDWDDPLRADRFRVWVFVVGIDTDWRAVATVSDSDAMLEDLPSGATVKVRVTSANAAGESAPGPEAEVVVP